MKFITGGAYQGKKDFVINNLNISENNIYNGILCDLNKIFVSKCVDNYHIFIKNLISKDINPIEFTQKLLSENNNVIIIMNEIGCGIVPIDENERFWREMCGKCGCIIAEKSEIVVRVVCGTGIIIKGKL